MIKAAVLVPDVQTRAQLAALRSLGRAGYDVHAVADSSDAMGLRSNFARHTAIHPAYGTPAFRDWLRDYCRTNAIRMIVPSGGLLFAVRDEFSSFSPLLPVAADPRIVFRAHDKIATYECWRDAKLLEHHPRTIIARPGAEPALAGFPTPIYVKGGQGFDGEIPGEGFHCCSSADSALEAISGMHRAGYPAVLIQGGVRGRQVGVGILMGPRGALAGNVVSDVHRDPHSKGTMSLRRTRWLQDIFDDAVRRLQALQWIGCAMVEYRREDESGNFHVIEVNARFWQYLHLDLHAGIDFPRLLAEWFLEGKSPAAVHPRQDVVCRDTFPGEFAQMVGALRHPRRRWFAVPAFVGRFLDPRIHSDLSFPGDRGIYYSEFRRFLNSELRQLTSKLRAQ